MSKRLQRWSALLLLTSPACGKARDDSQFDGFGGYGGEPDGTLSGGRSSTGGTSAREDGGSRSVGGTKPTGGNANGGNPLLSGGSPAGGAIVTDGGQMVASGGSTGGSVGCEGESFSSDGSPCSPWSDCDAGTYILRSGTNTSDRVCQPCPTGSYSGQNDFRCYYSGCAFGEMVVTEGTSTKPAECAPDPSFHVIQGDFGSQVLGLASDGNTAYAVLQARYGNRVEIWPYQDGIGQEPTFLDLAEGEGADSFAIGAEGALFLATRNGGAKTRGVRGYALGTEWTDSGPANGSYDYRLATASPDQLFILERTVASTPTHTLRRYDYSGENAEAFTVDLNVDFPYRIHADATNGLWIAASTYGNTQLFRVPTPGVDPKLTLSLSPSDTRLRAGPTAATPDGHAHVALLNAARQIEVIELGPDGTQLARRSLNLPGPGEYFPTAMDVLAGEYLVVAGSVVAENDPLDLGPDLFVARLRLTDNQIEVKLYPSPNYNQADYVTITSSGDVYAMDSFQGSYRLAVIQAFEGEL